ncbi:MAG: A/G-specific adenine glycosylase [Myxococcota bacterium]
MTARGAVVTEPGELPELQRALLAWAEQTLRPMPWRRTRDPWHILVSETMLQQTQVSRVELSFQLFTERWPTPAACAAAPRAAIIEAWAGLGYNRRAVNLHRAANVITADHDGVVPSGLAELLALPGVGPYTARAVRVFAFELHDAVVDVNAARVLSRAVAGAPMAQRELQALADAQVPVGRAWMWNQAVLELGATTCRKRVAHCERCPLLAHCAWAGRGDDPSVGSFGTGATQSRFEGSDRQGRGRVLEALRAGDLPMMAAESVTGWDDPERTGRVVASMMADGLLEIDQDVLTLPDRHGR